MFEIRAGTHFDAAHRLPDYNGPCARMHGHRFEVEAAVTGDELGPGEMLLDFHYLRRLLEEVVAPLDHNCLNDVDPFTEISPTSENLARFIYRALARKLADSAGGARLAWVGVSESPDTKALYREAD